LRVSLNQILNAREAPIEQTDQIGALGEFDQEKFHP
jgi:hypothetical protein